MKRNFKVIALAIVAALAFAACGVAQPNSQTQEQDVTERNQQNLIAQYPVPIMDTSLERNIMVQLYVLRNKARLTHSVILSDGTATPVFDCPSVGFPIANDVQLTNPEKIGYLGSYGAVTLPQPEPNGLYSAESSWGTWVLCAEENGNLAPVYNESNTITFPFPVTVDYATGKISKAGDSTMSINVDGESK